MSDEPELKPCPFCGSASIGIAERGWDYYCYCMDCGASIAPVSNRPDDDWPKQRLDAILKWNSRPPEQVCEWYFSYTPGEYCPHCGRKIKVME